jgi:hypothetical protein
VTIQIGADNRIDQPDTALYLADASGTIKVTKKTGLLTSQYAATVTMKDLSPGAQLSWLDASGGQGSVSVEDLATKLWPGLKSKATANGESVHATLSFNAADGTQQALLLDAVEVTRDAAGSYVFKGTLSTDPAINPTGPDVWDVRGKQLKALFEYFRKSHNIEAGPTQFTPVEASFAQGAFYIDTFTARSYANAGFYALDSEATQKASGATSAGVAGFAPSALETAATASDSAVTASIPLGNSFAIGRDDGSVELWTDGERKVLRYGGWGEVTQLLDYSRPLKDAAGNTVASTLTGYISGNTLTVTGLGAGSKVVVGSEITGEGVKAGTTVTKYVPQSGSFGGPGTYEVSIAQTVGSAVPAEKGSPAGITVTQTNVPAVAPAIVAGMANGSVQLWTATNGWTELHDSGWKAGVTTMINYGEGFVVGLDNGSVQQWNGPGTNPDTSTWKNNWTELHNDGWKSGVTAILPYKGRPDVCTGGCPGFLVGLANGSVMQYNDARNGLDQPGWWELHGAGWDSAVKEIVLSKYDQYGLPTFAVGLENGSVQQWQWTGERLTWDEIQRPGKYGWNSEITSMSQYDQNFIVGLANGAVEMRVNPSPATFVSSGGGAISPVPVTVSLPNTYTQSVGTVSQSGASSKARMDIALPTGATPSSFVGATVATAAQPNAAIGTITSYGFTTLSTVYNSAAGSVYTVGLSNPTYFQNVSSQPLILTQQGSSPTCQGCYNPNPVGQPSEVQFPEGAISNGVGSASGNMLQVVVPSDWVTTPGTCGLCGLMANPAGTISGPGIQVATITSYQGVGNGLLNLSGNVASFTIGGGPQSVGTQIPGKALQLTPTPGLDPAALIGQKVVGDGIPSGTVITGVTTTKPSGEVVYSVSRDVLVTNGTTVTTPTFSTETASTWVELHNDGWKYAVNQIVPFESATATMGKGVVVGLANGAVELWNGQRDPKPQDNWTELHNDGWDSGVGRIIPVPAPVSNSNGNVVSQNGVVVGLQNGAMEQWSGLITGGTGQNNWTELPTKDANEAKAILHQDGVYKSAVSFAWSLANSGATPVWGAAGSIGSSADPLFSNPALQARYQKALDGTYKPFVYSLTKTFSKAFTDPTDTLAGSVEIGYDVDGVSYGYVFVPDGILSKLSPGNYSVSAFSALSTGPSVTVNLQPGPDGTLVAGDWSLSKQWAGDNWSIGLGLISDVSAGLINSTDTLNAHAYIVPGLLATYNTNSSSGTQFAFDWAPDIDYTGFVDAGLTVTANTTPYVTANYTVPAPDSLRFLRKKPMLNVTMGYENPLTATVSAGAGNAVSLTLGASGTVTASVGVLGGLTSALDWKTTQQLYEVTKTFPDRQADSKG